MTASALPPAGWYPDAITAGVQRYWDGARWTAQTLPPTPQVVVPATPTPPQRPAKPGAKAPGLSTGAVVAIAVVGDIAGI